MGIFGKTSSEELEQLKSEYERLQRELADKEENIKRLVKSGNDSDAKVTELQEKIENLEKDLKEKSSALDQCEATANELKTELDKAKAELDKAKTDLENANEENKDLKDKKSALEVQVKELEQAREDSQPEISPSPESSPKTNQTPACNCDAKFEEVKAALKELKETIGEHAYKDKINKELHEDLMKKNANFYAELRRPSVKAIIKCHNRICDTFAHYKEQEASAEAFDKLLKQVADYIEAMRSILDEQFDLEFFSPAVGDEFNPKLHSTIEIKTTDDQSLDKKVAECIHGGFIDINTERVFDKALVKQFKFSSNN